MSMKKQASQINQFTRHINFCNKIPDGTTMSALHIRLERMKILYTDFIINQEDIGEDNGHQMELRSRIEDLFLFCQNEYSKGITSRYQQKVFNAQIQEELGGFLEENSFSEVNLTNNINTNEQSQRLSQGLLNEYEYESDTSTSNEKTLKIISTNERSRRIPKDSLSNYERQSTQVSLSNQDQQEHRDSIHVSNVRHSSERNDQGSAARAKVEQSNGSTARVISEHTMVSSNNDSIMEKATSFLIGQQFQVENLVQRSQHQSTSSTFRNIISHDLSLREFVSSKSRARAAADTCHLKLVHGTQNVKINSFGTSSRILFEGSFGYCSLILSKIRIYRSMKLIESQGQIMFGIFGYNIHRLKEQQSPIIMQPISCVISFPWNYLVSINKLRAMVLSSLASAKFREFEQFIRTSFSIGYIDRTLQLIGHDTSVQRTTAKIDLCYEPKIDQIFSVKLFTNLVEFRSFNAQNLMSLLLEFNRIFRSIFNNQRTKSQERATLYMPQSYLVDSYWPNDNNCVDRQLSHRPTNLQVPETNTQIVRTNKDHFQRMRALGSSFVKQCTTYGYIHEIFISIVQLFGQINDHRTYGMRQALLHFNRLEVCSPVKVISTPKLELCGSVLLSRLLDKIKVSLKLPDMNTFLYSDNTTVLAWLESHPNHYNTFVANRITDVQSLTKTSHWSFVATEQNPADCASRGVYPSQLKDHNLWWNGPEWLSKNQNEWPVYERNYLTEEEKRKLPINVFVASKVQEDDFLVNVLKKHSTLSRLVKNTAQFVKVFRHRKVKPLKDIGQTTAQELREALRNWIRYAQALEFRDEVERCKAGDELRKSRLPNHEFDTKFKIWLRAIDHMFKTQVFHSIGIWHWLKMSIFKLVEHKQQHTVHYIDIRSFTDFIVFEFFGHFRNIYHGAWSKDLAILQDIGHYIESLKSFIDLTAFNLTGHGVSFKKFCSAQHISQRKLCKHQSNYLDTTSQKIWLKSHGFISFGQHSYKNKHLSSPSCSMHLILIDLTKLFMDRRQLHNYMVWLTKFISNIGFGRWYKDSCIWSFQDQNKLWSSNHGTYNFDHRCLIKFWFGISDNNKVQLKSSPEIYVSNLAKLFLYTTINHNKHWKLLRSCCIELTTNIYKFQVVTSPNVFRQPKSLFANHQSMFGLSSLLLSIKSLKSQRYQRHQRAFQVLVLTCKSKKSRNHHFVNPIQEFFNQRSSLLSFELFISLRAVQVFSH